MNRREAISAFGAVGFAAAGVSWAADPVPPAKVADALSPTVTITEAIRLAEAHVKAEKVETAGRYLSSAQFLQTEGKARWEVRWDSTDRLVKGDWFIIRVGMDKQAVTVQGL